MLDAVKSGISRDEYANPEELTYCFCERDLQFSNMGPVYYHVENCKGVFHYLDGIEQRIPKEEKTICWEWGGVRQGTKYYVGIHFIGTTDTTYNIDETLNAVFDNQLTIADEFEMPSVERDYEEDGYKWPEGKYDDDSHLRVVEECTYGRSWVEWERLYPETEGCSGNTFIALASLIVGIIPLVMTITDRIKIRIRKSYYSCKIARLRRIVIKETDHKGHIMSPNPMPPKYVNAETGKKEYLFYQVLDDGRERNVFIGADGTSIRKGKYS